MSDGPVYGVLLSHAPGCEVIGAYPSVGHAKHYGNQVAAAQPGIEFEVMWRDDNHEWASIITGKNARETTHERWAAEQAARSAEPGLGRPNGGGSV